MSLFKLLSDYADSDPIRFHMPGHKGRLSFPNPYELDVTEFGDFDDLHNADGAISEIEDQIAKLYQAKASKLLVNGTTVGILSAVFAMIEENDTVLVSRYSHKSILNALMLRKARTVFYNHKFDEYGIAKPVDLTDIQNIINDNKDIKLVIITSPTYEGVVSDIKDLNNVLSKKRIPLLVDAAHGAHFGLYGEKPHPIMVGCDIAVTSLHKTLPFFTQSAALLISEKGKRYEDKIKFYLDCFESSSPSYIFMAGADKGVKLLKQDGKRLFEQYNACLESFYNQVKTFNYIKVIDYEYKDRGKIVITGGSTKAIEIIGKTMEKENIFPEMTTSTYILCMASIMNNSEDYNRLYKCLERADSEIELSLENDYKKRNNFILNYPIPKHRYTMSEALKQKISYKALEEAEGLVSGGIIDVFPPGVPLILPGEEIEKEFIGLVKKAKEHNIIIRGIVDGKIPVI